MSAHLATAATVRARLPTGTPRTYLCSRVEVIGRRGLVKATARRKDFPDWPEREYVWAAGRVLQIKWEAAAHVA